MYFITNQNGNIVAANKDFLEEIGSKDICLIATSLKSKQIILNEDDSKLFFENSDSEFKYNKSTLYSPFGDLNLYQIFESKADSSDIDDIEYLKKIKEGTIDTQDKNFNIPEILNKDNLEKSEETKQKEITKTDEKNIEDINQISQQNLELLEKIESKEELTPTLESIEEETNKEEKLINTPEIELIDNKEIENELDTTKEKIINIETNKEEIEEDNTGGGLDFLKSKLFPWGSTNKEQDDKDIEIEEEHLITPAKDLIDTDEAKEEKNNLIEILNEKPKEEIIYEKIDNKSENQDEKEELETLENSLTNTEEKFEENKELNLIQDIEPQKNQDNLTLEEEELLILKETTSTNKDANIKESIKVEEDTEPIETTIIENVVKESDDKKVKEHKKEDILLNKLIDLQAKRIDFKQKAENISIDVENYKLLLSNFLDELDNYKDDLKRGDRATIDMLIDASTLLDLEPITKKLNSIHSNYNKELSFKELYLLKDVLKSRLNSNEDIEKPKVNTTPTIIENTQENIKDNSEALKTIEIENNREELKEDIIDKEILQELQEEEETPPKIPTEAIEIKDATQLYNAIESVDTDFDIDKPSTELNLPKSLILEFVSDFVTQAKDHIPNIVNYYNTRDIKAIQTTAHMLKGAASNLRLDKIAEILFSIQKENSLENSGELVKKFIAHLKGLEDKLKNIESEKNED